MAAEKTPLDDLKVLAGEGLEDRILEECHALAALVLEEFGIDRLTPGQRTQLLREMLTGFADKCRGIMMANLRMMPPIDDREMGKVLAGAELLGLTNEEDHAELRRGRGVREEYWSQQLRHHSSPKKRRQLRAGVWTERRERYSYSAAMRGQAKLLQTFLSRLKSYLQDEQVAESVRRRYIVSLEPQPFMYSEPSRDEATTIAATRSATQASWLPTSSLPVLHESPTRGVHKFAHLIPRRFYRVLGQHWVALALASATFVAIVSSRLLPPYSKGFAVAVDYLLSRGYVGIPLVITASLTGWAMVEFSLRQRLKGVVVAIVVAAALVYAGGHWYGYYRDTEFARALRQDAGQGTSVYINGFDDDGPCPEYHSSLETPYPFTECDISNGVLRAEVTAVIHRAAIHAASNSSFVTGYFISQGEGISPSHDEREFRPAIYYIQTRFRVANQASIRSCGITLESAGDIYLFRVNRATVEGQEGYIAEVARIPQRHENADRILPETEDGTPWIGPGIDAIATSAILPPYIKRSAIPNLDNDEWTKLALLVTGRFHTVLVNDRVALRFEHGREEADTPQAPLRYVTRASVAVISGSDQSGGSATCEFDYLRVKSLSL